MRLLSLQRKLTNKAVVARMVIAAFIAGGMLEIGMSGNVGNGTAPTPAATRKVVATAMPTPTVMGTVTSKPTATVAVATPTPDANPMTALAGPDKFQVFTVRISYYWPALGGTNCYPTNWIIDASNPYGGVCRSKLLGAPWSDWVGVGAACPPSIKLRQRIHIESLGKSYYCVDRGGAIQDLYDGTRFVDLLIPAPVWWPDAEVITDHLCPSGCLTSKAWIVP